MVATNFKELKFIKLNNYIIDNLIIEDECKISLPIKQEDYLLKYINSFKVPYINNNDVLQLVYPNSIDLLDKILDSSFNNEVNSKLNEIFSKLLNPPKKQEPLQCYFKKEYPEAVIPSKVRCSDSGYDITIIKEKSKSGEATLYDTGIRIIPPPGYNIVIRPRSSFYKTGYMIANTIGTIDTSYRNTLFVPLIKIDKSKPDITLPFKGFQIILERFNHFKLIEDEKKFDYETHRNLGGFGSTDLITN